MTREKKLVEKNDLMNSDVYSKGRREYRKKLREYKKNRRISLGPYAIFYFESFETMLGQIQEMLHIEKGGDEQLKDELSAYNPLIPKGNELVATLMFEIDNPNLRAKFLNQAGGIEKNIYMLVGKEKIQAEPEQDLDRTSAEGKASSVQFVHFKFNKEQIKNFQNFSVEIILGIKHKLYSHTTKILKEVKSSLIKDFT